MEKRIIEENRRKELLYALFAIFGCLMIAYLPFMQTHYSSDSYANVNGIDVAIHLRNGRVVTYFVQSLVNFLGFNPVKHQAVTVGVVIFALALSVLLIYMEMVDCVRDSVWKRAVILGGLLVVYINVFFAEWLLYVESLTSAPIGIMLVTVAAVYASRKIYVKNLIVSWLLLLCALNMYQIYIEFFMVLSLLIIYVQYKGRLEREAFIRSIVVVGEGVIGSIVTIILHPLIIRGFGLQPPDRVTTLDIQAILSNAELVLGAQQSIWSSSLSLLPKGVLLGTILALFSLFFAQRWKNISETVYGLLALAFVPAITLAPHVISTVVWMAPRTIVGVFHVVTVLLIMIGVGGQKKKNDICIVIAVPIMCMFMLVSMYSINGIIVNNIATNHLDEALAVQIERGIQEYQGETGVAVTKIAAVNDESPTYIYDGVRYVSHDMNIRGLVVQWAGVELINHYCDREYQKVEMPDDIYDTYFRGKNWDYFDLNEQAVFDGDTLYLAMY